MASRRGPEVEGGGWVSPSFPTPASEGTVSRLVRSTRLGSPGPGGAPFRTAAAPTRSASTRSSPQGLVPDPGTPVSPVAQVNRAAAAVGAVVPSFGEAHAPEFPVAGRTQSLAHSDELQRLQRDYERTARDVYSDSLRLTGGNPFQGGLGDETPTNPPPEEPNPGQNTDVVPPPQTGDTSPGRPEIPPGGRSEPIYDFLLISDFSGQGKQALRAYREESGDFVLEDLTRLNFFAGITHRLLIFPEGEQLITLDYDGDGRLDFLLVRVGTAGSLIGLFRQSSEGLFLLDAQGFLPNQRVLSLAAVQTSADSPELAVAVAGGTSLLILRRLEETFTYSRELVLPLRPGIVMRQDFNPQTDQARLRVFDTSLNQSVDVIFRASVALLASGPVARFESLQLQIQGRDNLIRLLQDSNQIVLAEHVGGLATLIANVDTSLTLPLVLLGDYQNRSTRQLVVLP